MKHDIHKIVAVIGMASLAIACAICFARPAPAFAQAADEADRAREALERTDDVIARAGQLIDETRSEKARVTLRFAVELQARAWNDYRSRGYRVALRLTLEARDEAWHAMSLARADTRSEESFSRVSEEARERLINVRDMMIDSGIRNEHAMKLIDEARGLLDNSRLNAQQNRYQLALKLAVNARQLAIKAEEHIRSTRMIKEAVERRIALLERLIERARERVRESGDEKASAELQAAERKLAQAHEFMNAGRFREARQSCESCERMLRGVVRRVPSAAVGDPGARLEEAYRLLERAREMLGADGLPSPEATEALERAEEMLGRAGVALGAGREAEALALIGQTREMLRKAVGEERGALTRERIMLQIQRLATIRGEAQNLVAECSAPGVRELVARADEHLARAREHFQASQFESASAEAVIARNMYRRISDLCAR